MISGHSALLPEQGESRDEGDGDGRSDELVVLLLDGAGDPHGEHLVAVVPTRFQVDGFVLPALCDQTLDVVFGHGLAPGVDDRLGGVREKTEWGTPLLIEGGFERSPWQQNPTRRCAARERFTLLMDR